MKHNTSLLSRKASLLKLRFSILLIIILLSAVCKCQESSKLNGTLISDKNDNNSDNQNTSRKDYDAYTISDLWTTILERSSKSSNFESFNELFTECNMLSVRKRNLTEMTILMAYAMNRAIMKKLKAVENLVKVAEESFKNYTSNQDTRNSTFAKEYFNSKSLKLCANETENITVSTSVNKNGNTSSSATISLTLSNASVNAITARPNKSNKTRKEDIKGKKQEYFKGDNDKYCLTLHPNRHFMDLNVNLTYSTVHVPTIIYEQSDEILHSAAWSFHLNNAFLENYQNDPEITWQYFCGATGLYRTWPGTEWTYPDNMPKNKLVDLFDCRVRTWYVKATSSPRDVVILIDSSGSMTGIKRSIAVQTVETILDTLSDDDFVNILSFNNVIQYVDPCFQNGLVQATVENRKHLRDAIEDLPTNDIASLSEALIRAFKILNHARINIAKTEKVKCICQSHYIDSEMNISTDSACILSDNELRELENETSSNNSHNSFLDSSGCNKMIMLVTDGANENAVDVFRELNWKVNYTYSCHLKETRVFTYLIGRELGDERPVKWMACANRGL
ncbi:hypothetical protein GJ496_002711 [Pomphorhynchus laevis]|nr:hypothetical protein GJ496_002711 [Pomphorhynchus laevis]